MEVTALFKACVKTAKTKNKALGLLTNSGNVNSRPSKSIEKTTPASKDSVKIRQAKSFMRKAKEVVGIISVKSHNL